MSKLNKIIYSILVIIIIIFIVLVIKDKFKIKQYIKEYDYYNSTTIVKIETNKNHNIIFNKIETLFNENKNIKEINKDEILNNKISNYLNSINIKKYFINSNDTILVKGKHTVGLINPKRSLSDLKVINITDKCVSSINGINVVSSDKCQTYALKIKDMTVNEGLNYINKIDDAEAIWFIDDTFNGIKSNNFKKYE